MRIPSGLRRRVLQVYAHPQFLSQEMAELEAARRALRQPSQEAALEQVRQLRHLGGTCT